MGSPFKVLVCGGREYNNWSQLEWYLSNIITDPHHGGKIWPYEIIHGCARGADTLAQKYADERGLVTHRFPANWNQYGKAAGYIRNKQMLEEGKPDLVIAFEGGRGTEMMIDLAQRAGVEVIKVGKEA